jgi:hypothetical protein
MWAEMSTPSGNYYDKRRDWKKKTAVDNTRALWEKCGLGEPQSLLTVPTKVACSFTRQSGAAAPIWTATAACYPERITMVFLIP